MTLRYRVRRLLVYDHTGVNDDIRYFAINLQIQTVLEFVKKKAIIRFKSQLLIRQIYVHVKHRFRIFFVTSFSSG